MKSANPFAQFGRVAAIWTLALALVAPTIAFAQTYTPREIALLPEYCRFAGAGPEQRNAVRKPSAGDRSSGPCSNTSITIAGG